LSAVVFGKNPLKPDDVCWMNQSGNSGYLADPSGFLRGEELHILAEDYYYKTERAIISEITWNASTNCFSVPWPIIDDGKHLSYPFVVRSGDTIYCIPEAYRSGGVTMYRRELPGETFSREHVLLQDADAVDPTLVRYNDRWWMFLTRKQSSSTHLEIWYSDELNGPYLPHGLNPVKTDIRSSRPAGTPFFHEGILYRPAQDCSKVYGGRIIICRIDELTHGSFRETEVASLDPVAGSRFDRGLHTVSGVGDYTLIDGKRYGFNLYFFLSQVKRKLGNSVYKFQRNVS
jgi:hypothetical protein